MMNRLLAFTSLLILALTLSACAGLVTEAPAGDPTEASQPDEKAADEQVATDTDLPSADDQSPSPTPTPAPPTETPTEPPTATASPEPPTATPTATATDKPPAFDPQEEYGGPTILDTFASDANWVAGDGALPDTNFIRLVLGTEQLLVTGKPENFDTWWFTWPTAADQFIQMKVETDTCSGKQAYGLILRGPATNTGAHGYILTFSCDGAYRLRRLDSANPYSFEELVAWKTSESINAGSDKSNTFGVRLLGDTITIYANGDPIDEVVDDTFASGRFGLFVNGGADGDFTFRLTEFAFWNLD